MTEQCRFRRHLTWQQTCHNPEVAGSNPAPATGKAPETGLFLFSEVCRPPKLCPIFALGRQVTGHFRSPGATRAAPAARATRRRDRLSEEQLAAGEDQGHGNDHAEREDGIDRPALTCSEQPLLRSHLLRLLLDVNL